ncbi:MULTISPECIES: hypothetical protein [unclassified Raoultella]|uniref:hypothetical protein n=1 Tax=unclassified Raoultella TaxID=2627600 RepID=UPI001D1201F3|nr:MULTISPECIES: hypothetical protein [unclassified Raoultella]
MTSKLTKEWLQHQISAIEAVGITDSNTLAAFKLALAAMDSESWCLLLDYLQGHKDGLEWASQLAEANHPETGDWLYDDPIELAKAIRKGPDMSPAQPAPVVPVVPDEIKHRIGGLDWGWGGEFNRCWNACRAAMLQESQKSAGESNNCRRSEKVQDLQAGNCRENGNSSTNNFREIAETSTGTAITPAAPDKKLTDDVLDEIIAGAKTSMEQYLALSLKAEREVWRKEGPTDDERIMAIEGIHNCERCGDEGWVVGEMGIIRCACGQAGNSPVIPDGYVMVPKEPTKEMIDAGWLHFMGTKNPSSKGTYKAMLAAAPQEVQGE